MLYRATYRGSLYELGLPIGLAFLGGGVAGLVWLEFLAGTSFGVALLLAVTLFVVLTRPGPQEAMADLRRSNETLRAELAECDRERARWRTALTGLRDGVLITDPEGRVDFLNDVAERLTGWCVAEARGRPVQEVFDLREGRDGEPAGNPVAECLRSGNCITLSGLVQLRARDGTLRPVDNGAAPVHDASGKLLGAALIFREASGRPGEQRSDFLTEVLPQLVWTARPDGAKEFVNRRWQDYTGQSEEEARGHGWLEVLHPEDVARARAAWEEAVGMRGGFELELRYRRKDDGSYRWHLVRAVPQHDGENRLLRWLGTSTDMHDLKERTDMLQETGRRKDEFLAVLAHELRNPLAPIMNALHLLKLAGSDRPTVDHARDIMERQVRQMVRLIDDLLDVTRFSRGKVELRSERVEIAGAVRVALETSLPLIDAARHQLNVSMPDEPLWVNGDPARLAQVLANLLNNAAKYTDPGGVITLSAAREGDEVVLRVRDTGVGIPADKLPRIFELFTQVDTTPGRSQGGLGIGLSLVKSLTELHGGRVEAVSTGPGRGSEFTIRLPAADPPSGALPGDPVTVQRRELCRVLVVDDNRDAAQSLARLLRGKGHDVRVAFDGAAALREAETFKPEAVVCDVSMPGMDGYEVARRLRALPGMRNVTLAALTGHDHEDDRARAQEAGFDRHFTKPVDPEELQLFLSKVVRRRP